MTAAASRHEPWLHVLGGGEPIDAIDLDRVIRSAVTLDLTPVPERAIVEADPLEAAAALLAGDGEMIRPGDIVPLRTDAPFYKFAGIDSAPARALAKVERETA